MIKHLFTKALTVGSFLGILTSTSGAITGFYGGLAIGGAHLAGNHVLAVTRGNPAAPASQKHNTNMSAHAVHGEIFAGYGQKVNEVWFALEANYGLSNLETKTLLDITGFDSQQPLTIKSRQAAGLSVHMGYHVNPKTMAYIKLGFETRKFNADFNGANNNADPILNHTKGYYSTAFAPGFGIETEVTPDITFRTEYKVGLHSQKHHQTHGDHPEKTSLKTRPTMHHMTVGLHYKI